MKDYRVTLNEYEDYLLKLRKNIFAILPLYDEGNEFIHVNVSETIDEVINVKDIINELPNGHWYVKTLANLKSLEIEVVKEDNLKVVRRKVLNTTNLITQEIDSINK